MEVDRKQIDKNFDRYVLSQEQIKKTEFLLRKQVLPPLDVTKVTRKAQWDARVHHNVLVADPFRSSIETASIAYFIDEAFRLIQVEIDDVQTIATKVLYEFPMTARRLENVSLQVPSKGMIVYSDGTGTITLLKYHEEKWNQALECSPFGVAPLSLLGASAVENNSMTQVHCLIGRSMEGDNKESSYRLYIADLYFNKNSMEVDEGNQTNANVAALELMETAALPSYVCLKNTDIVFLVEGKYELNAALKIPQTSRSTKSNTDGDSNTHKRHHEEAETDEEEDELVPKCPRAGIGYHGEVPAEKHVHELGSLNEYNSLESRFLKSSKPFSSLDEPLHCAKINNGDNKNLHEGRFEVPTPDSILGGFEECDDFDPNAMATIFRFNAETKNFFEKFDIDCRNFHFLSSSSHVFQSASFDTLLFQHDVHGLVYEITIVNEKMSLKHKSTLPAFGFVQASKQEKKFLTCHPTGSFAIIGEFEKRIFAYHGKGSEEEVNKHIRKQNVIEIGNHQLLGIQIMGPRQVLLLTPHHLTSILLL